MIRRSQRYSHPMALNGMTNSEQHDATGVSIGSHGLVEKQRFYYLFDYGDEWWHEVTYEGIKDCKEREYPSVLLKNGESPEQYPEIDDYD